MVAHRFEDKIEFWFLDSKNRDYLTWNEEEISKFLSTENENRKRDGKTVWKQFQIWVNHNAILDAQYTMDIIINCLLGNKNIFEYAVDAEVDVIYSGISSSPEFSKLFEQFQNINKIIEEYSNEQFNKILEEVVGYCQSCGEPLYLLLLAKDKVKYMGKKSREILGKIGKILMRIITDKRYKGNDGWIDSYFYVFKSASELG